MLLHILLLYHSPSLSLRFMEFIHCSHGGVGEEVLGARICSRAVFSESSEDV